MKTDNSHSSDGETEETTNNGEADTLSQLAGQVDELKRSFTYISHQMSMIMKALHVDGCPCDVCKSRHLNGNAAAAAIANENLMKIMQDYSQRPGGGKLTVDRRAVSEYAQAHGAIAAARKFGVAPPVASYYQRKESKQMQSPGPSSEGEEQTDNQQGPPILPVMDTVLKMNVAHSSGSPGFLRGRGRGRPKLIGDELDADLVDYMVSVKQADPHNHFTASQALQIAKDYILEKAPGLLEEHGGHVKLKLTWAMKLVSRIAERQKEMELGLPPGTLSNMGRQMTGGSIMADMVAHNIIGQHLLDPLPPPVATPEITNVRELNLSFPLDSETGEITNGEE